MCVPKMGTMSVVVDGLANFNENGILENMLEARAHLECSGAGATDKKN